MKGRGLGGARSGWRQSQYPRYGCIGNEREESVAMPCQDVSSRVII